MWRKAKSINLFSANTLIENGIVITGGTKSLTYQEILWYFVGNKLTCRKSFLYSENSDVFSSDFKLVQKDIDSSTLEVRTRYIVEDTQAQSGIGTFSEENFKIDCFTSLSGRIPPKTKMQFTFWCYENI